MRFKIVKVVVTLLEILGIGIKGPIILAAGRSLGSEHESESQTEFSEEGLFVDLGVTMTPTSGVFPETPETQEPDQSDFHIIDKGVAAVTQGPKPNFTDWETGNDFEGDIQGISINTLQDTVTTFNKAIPPVDGELENARKDPFYKWPNGTIYYEIAPEFLQSDIDTIHEAMWRLQNISCVRFVEHTVQKDYILIQNGERCSSAVGRQMGKQTISIKSQVNSRCDIARIMHELIHAMGFWHEQSRPDRDQYVIIHRENILDEKEGNFQKYGLHEASTLNEPYDTTSIMHYGSHYFSKGNLPTIEAQPGQPPIPYEIKTLSALDATKIKKYYACSDSAEGEECTEDQFQCPNGKCIKQDYKCDGDNDCGDGYDEGTLVCGGGKVCQYGFFICTNQAQCIRQSFKCDGIEDCLDGSDETVALCGELWAAPFLDKSVSSTDVEGREGHIFSDNRENNLNYPTNIGRRWNITAPNGHVVSLHFHPNFALEPNGAKCFDYLDIYEGQFIEPGDAICAQWPKIAPKHRLCGNIAPSRIESTSNRMVLEFCSDSSTTEIGFKLLWNTRLQNQSLWKSRQPN